LPEQKEMLLLHPLNERMATQKDKHVPRHIELTAVTLKSVTEIKRVRESKDLENH